MHDVPLSDAWWNGPMFFPTANSMALSELLISQLPISWVVQAATGNPVAAYNVVFALSFPLCALAAWALARELTGRADAALVAGLAFMLAPYRAQQLSHVQVLSYYWAPLVLLGLHRYLRERRVKWLVLFAGAWLAQSLANGYAMFHLSVLVALWIVWFMRPLRTSLPVLGAWACAGLVMLPMLLKYEARALVAAPAARHQRGQTVRSGPGRFPCRGPGARGLGRTARAGASRDRGVSGSDDRAARRDGAGG